MKNLFFIFITTLLIGNIALAQTSTTSGSQEKNNKGATNFNIYSAHPSAIDPQIFIYEAKPGDTIHDKVVVKNIATYKNKFYIYPADSYKSEKGNDLFSGIEETPKDVGAWIKLEKNAVDMEPEERINFNLEITVPKDTPYGDYIGGIAGQKMVNEGSISTALRVVKRVKIKVTDDPQPIAPFIPKSGQANIFGLTPLSLATVFIFLASMSYLLVSKLKNRAAKKNTD